MGTAPGGMEKVGVKEDPALVLFPWPGVAIELVSQYSVCRSAIGRSRATGGAGRFVSVEAVGDPCARATTAAPRERGSLIASTSSFSISLEH